MLNAINNLTVMMVNCITCIKMLAIMMQIILLGQSHFWRAYNLFVARVASFANDATRDTNKLYARQKSFDYHFYQYTRPNGCLSPSFD